MVLEGLKAALAAESDIAVIATAGSGQEAIEVASKTQPDVVMLDLGIPEPSGGQLIQQLREKCSARILVLTMVDDDDRLQECMNAGASGYMLKGTDVREVADTIRVAAAGDIALSPKLMSRLMSKVIAGDKPGGDTGAEEALSRRELEVLQLVKDGMTNRAIANTLYLSERTIKSYLAQVFKKFGVEDRTAAVVEGLRRGLIDLDEAS